MDGSRTLLMHRLLLSLSPSLPLFLSPSLPLHLSLSPSINVNLYLPVPHPHTPSDPPPPPSQIVERLLYLRDCTHVVQAHIDLAEQGDEGVHDGPGDEGAQGELVDDDLARVHSLGGQVEGAVDGEDGEDGEEAAVGAVEIDDGDGDEEEEVEVDGMFAGVEEEVQGGMESGSEGGIGAVLDGDDDCQVSTAGDGNEDSVSDVEFEPEGAVHGCWYFDQESEDTVVGNGKGASSVVLKSALETERIAAPATREGDEIMQRGVRKGRGNGVKRGTRVGEEGRGGGMRRDGVEEGTDKGSKGVEEVGILKDFSGGEVSDVLTSLFASGAGGRGDVWRKGEGMRGWEEVRPGVAEVIVPVGAHQAFESAEVGEGDRGERMEGSERGGEDRFGERRVVEGRIQGSQSPTEVRGQGRERRGEEESEESRQREGKEEEEKEKEEGDLAAGTGVEGVVAGIRHADGVVEQVPPGKNFIETEIEARRRVV